MDKKHRHHVCSLFTLGGREGAAPGLKLFGHTKGSPLILLEVAMAV